MSKRRKKIKRRKRRPQSDILISILKSTPSSRAHSPASISSIAQKSGTNWRTTKKNIDMLTKAGIIEKVKEKGKRRLKYKKL